MAASELASARSERLRDCTRQGPGPKTFVLCKTHGHVIDADQQMSSRALSTSLRHHGINSCPHRREESFAYAHFLSGPKGDPMIRGYSGLLRPCRQ